MTDEDDSNQKPPLTGTKFLVNVFPSTNGVAYTAKLALNPLAVLPYAEETEKEYRRRFGCMADTIRARLARGAAELVEAVQVEFPELELMAKGGDGQ